MSNALELLEQSNPGSFEEFTAVRAFNNHKEALGAYSLALDGYRQTLADYYGVSIEDLRNIGSNY